MDQLDARLYLALAIDRNVVTSVLALFFAAFATNGLGWWALALGAIRARGLNRQGLAIFATVAAGANVAWFLAEVLKPIVRRQRPFTELAVDALIRPVTYSFPSGDTALSFGAAAALGAAWPALRPLAYLIACAVALSRVVVGAHYPSDVAGGAILGLACGLGAARVWRIVARRLRWTVLVLPEDRPALRVDTALAPGEVTLRDLQAGVPQGARAATLRWEHDLPSQLPQLLRGLGVETLVLRQPAADASPPADAAWQGPSGDRLYALGASIAAPAAVERALPRSADGAILAVADAALADASLAALGAGGFQARIAAPDSLGALLDRVAVSRVGPIEGPPSAPRHASSGSVRWPLQDALRACERELLERCEPFDALAGGPARDTLRELWARLLAALSRERMSGRVPDALAAEVLAEIELVRREAERLGERLAAELAGAGSAPAVWNGVPWERTAVVELDGVPRRVLCAPFGFAPAVALPLADLVRILGDGVIENDQFRVTLDADGSFVVEDLGSGRRSGRQNLIVDDGDRGDLSTFSFAGPTVGARGTPGRVDAQVRGDRAVATAAFDLELPASLRSDRLARSGETVRCPVTVEVSLEPGRRLVGVTVTVDNRARDHRLRALCETGVRAVTHVAGSAFAWVERPNRPRFGRGMIERPSEIAVADEMVAVVGDPGGVALAGRDVREYAVMDDGATVALTLVRSVGWLSRQDLRERRGPAGAAIETPDAQVPGERTFSYAVVPFLRDGDALCLAARAIREALCPARLDRGDGARRLLCELDGDSAVYLAALRSTGDRRVLVARLVNPWRVPANATLRFAQPIVSARAVDLREGRAAAGEALRTSAPPELTDGRLAVRLGAYEIGTYLIAFD